MTSDAKWEGRRNRKETYGQYVLLIFGTVVVIFLVGYGLISGIHWYQTKDATLANLVKQVQSDIKEIDANSSEWKVDEAQVELNFVVTDATKTTADLKAAGTEIGTEKENAHRLVLTLRRVHPTMTGTENSNKSGIVPPEEKPTRRKAKD